MATYRVMVENSDLLTRATALAAKTGFEEDGLDLIYTGIDAFMRAGDFAGILVELVAADPTKAPLVFAMALCSISRGARDHYMDAWTDYRDRLRARILVTDPDDVEELMAGWNDA